MTPPIIADEALPEPAPTRIDPFARALLGSAAILGACLIIVALIHNPNPSARPAASPVPVAPAAPVPCRCKGDNCRCGGTGFPLPSNTGAVVR